MITDDEIILLAAALAKAAARHETQSRHLGGGRFARRHDDTAAAMRQLRARLLTHRENLLGALNLADEAVTTWSQFDDPDVSINGGALVEWFAEWRSRAKHALGVAS